MECFSCSLHDRAEVCEGIERGVAPRRHAAGCTRFGAAAKRWSSVGLYWRFADDRAVQTVENNVCVAKQWQKERMLHSDVIG